MRARDFALLQLDAKHLPGWPNDCFRRHLSPADRPEDPRDAALAEQITIGVVKNLFLLQHLISVYAQRPLDTIEAQLQKILSVAMYQVRFLDRVPASAAVHQGVEQAKRFGRQQAAGFVNAILRRATRESGVMLPDPIAAPADHAYKVLSHPKPLFERLEKLLGNETALALCRMNNAEPPMLLRLARDVTPEQLASPDIKLTPHEKPGMFVVEGARQALLAEWSRKGLAQVQDATAASVVDACQLQEGNLVLDRCCGLGTKSLQLAEQVGPTGRVVGIDPSNARCEVLRKLALERGLSNVTIHQAAMMKDASPDLPLVYERALLDVPCSNSGVLSRRPEARYHQDEATLQSLGKLQESILVDTVPHVAPGGLLIYSTCSIWPEENQDRVKAFLEGNPQFELVEQHTTLPSLVPDPKLYHDGGYVAVMKRI